MQTPTPGLDAATPAVKISPEDLARFWAKVDKLGPYPNPLNPNYLELGRCWIWVYSLNTSGYGQFSVNNRLFLAHRFSYLLAFGQFDQRQCILHRCDNPKCVNPSHLFAGTQSDNVEDMMFKGRHRLQTGEKNGKSKLSESDVVEIERRYAEGEKQIPIAHDYGVCVHTISRIICRKAWAHRCSLQVEIAQMKRAPVRGWRGLPGQTNTRDHE